MSILKLTTTTLFAASLACTAFGQTQINQTNAMLGLVTPGDTAGFPVTISQSGSYQLTSNLTLPNANSVGIYISADDVTIDLNGFGIIGPTVCSGTPTTCTGTGTGVGILAVNHFTVVKNGFIRGMGTFGIDMSQGTIDNVKLISNGNLGIQLLSGVATNSTALNNGGIGFRVYNGTASNNWAIGNGGAGISTASATVLNNTALNNGTVGIDVTCPGAVANNTAHGNLTANLSIHGTTCAQANNAAQ